MADRFTLTDGGAYFHTEQPVGFHPALRAAAHLIQAARSLDRGLLRSLREEVLPWHPPTLRRLLSPRGAGLSGSPPAPAPPIPPAVEYLDRLHRWTTARHIASPYVLEVLSLTLSAWHQVEERRRCGEPVAETGDASPWIEALTSPPEEVDVAPLLPTLGDLPHLRVPVRGAPNLRLVIDGWDPETEPFEAAEARLRRAVGRWASEHRTRTERSTRSRSLRRLRLRPARRHFTWLARRQLQGWRPVQIARRYKVSSTSVHRALRPLADLLELDLRPVKTGRPGL
ncbi:MAG TPA: hypothetical protein VKU40_02460 [Thermoanaerobaculia bacterium]|nr:hypothetical protein [Thermoanaerobaculia bacterium]